MKRTITLFLSSMLVFSAFSQAISQKKADKQTEEFRYEIEPSVMSRGQASTGTAIVRVWTYSKKENIAKGQAGKNAIHGILFKGYPDYRSGQVFIAGREAMIADPAVETNQADYFDKFFSSNDYQRYLTYVNNEIPAAREKIGKEYKIAVDVVVMVDALRKRLIADGVISDMSEVMKGKMPTLIVTPSRAWCNNAQHKYMKTTQQLGKTVYSPDYEAALLSDKELGLVINKLNEMLVKRGFTVKDLNAALEEYNNEVAADAARMSKNGAEVAETGEDKLMKVVGADIRIEVDFTINSIEGGSKKYMDFMMSAIDAYTQSPIASQQSSGTPQLAANARPALMVESAVVGRIDGFCNMITDHYKDLEKNGHEMTVVIQTWDDFEDGMYAEFDGDELHEILDDWMADNTVRGKYNRTKTSDNYLRFEHVRVPLQDSKGRDMDAMRWIRDLQKKLRNDYQIESKATSVGLGKVVLMIGSK